ncbi:MAG: hypothetical protein MK141_03725 [Pseudoxanthomonas sp.]|jgi:hypothetical protein|uniref:hypothetical protein n=1 Tax=Pseudoxanthomonas TaxID=83618 RepID=UPI001389BC4D|nr:MULTISPECIES: hypothetical protein [Pseudoxanthomonas]KAF1728316.1 hypothetical protein CSC76_06025 [Pseudoxanthomonas mexicana]MCH2090674.1 hypothetical protein [Pseudoxanthomonas sp.]
MDASKLVAEELAKDLLGSHLDRYRKILSKYDPDKAAPVFGAAIRAFQHLAPQDQAAIAAFLGVVITDTASIILGVIDGSTGVDNLAGEFQLSYEGSLVSGSLQDHFLAASETRFGA